MFLLVLVEVQQLLVAEAFVYVIFELEVTEVLDLCLDAAQAEFVLAESLGKHGAGFVELRQHLLLRMFLFTC